MKSSFEISEFLSTLQQVESRSVLSRRTNSVPSEITEEDDSLGDQIRELKVLFVLLSHICNYHVSLLYILTLRYQLCVLFTGRAH